MGAEETSGEEGEEAVAETSGVAGEGVGEEEEGTSGGEEGAAGEAAAGALAEHKRMLAFATSRASTSEHFVVWLVLCHFLKLKSCPSAELRVLRPGSWMPGGRSCVRLCMYHSRCGVWLHVAGIVAIGRELARDRHEFLPGYLRGGACLLPRPYVGCWL